MQGSFFIWIRVVTIAVKTAGRSVCDADKTLALISIPPGSSGLIHREGDICCYAQDFGELRKKEVLEVRTRFEQSAEIQIHIELL